MATRNFHFLKSPTDGERGGHFVVGDSSAVLTSGVPVLVTGGVDPLDRKIVGLAPEGTARPNPGQGGVLNFESISSLGYDADIYTYSDYDEVRPGDAVQVVTGNGGRVKAAFTTTESGTSLLSNRSGYPRARVMVAGAKGATPTVSVGDYLIPGAGNATAGYWKTTATKADAWLYVTEVDGVNGVVEAEFLI